MVQELDHGNDRTYLSSIDKPTKMTCSQQLLVDKSAALELQRSLVWILLLQF